MDKIILILAVLALQLFVTPEAFAQNASNCQPIYGGGPTCMQSSSLSIDKKIQNPQTSLFADTLGSNDFKFSPDDEVAFQITVKNTSGSKIEKITLKDTFPQFVAFVSGNGTYNQNNKTLTFIIPTLKPDESKTFNIIGKVLSNQELPDQAISCVINRVVATVGTQTSEDNAGVCIQKEVLGTTSSNQSPIRPISLTPKTQTKGGLKIMQPTKPQEQPSTGPEALILFALLPAGFAGYLLRKKSQT